MADPMTWTWLAVLLGLGSFAMAATMTIVLIGYLLMLLVLIIPTWRICTRAGFSGALSLFHLVPLIGPFIVMAVLAFSAWPNGEAARPLISQGRRS